MSHTQETAQGIVVIDVTGIIQEINPAVTNLFGYQSGELVGKNVRTLMPSPFEEEHDEMVILHQRLAFELERGHGSG